MASVISMPVKSLSHEEVVARLAMARPRLQILGRYTSKRTPVELKCLDCLHQWKARLDNKWNQDQGNGCPKCAITNRSLTDDERKNSRLRIIERTRVWRKENPEKYKEQCRRHRKANHATILETARRYRERNHRDVLEYHREYRKANREKHKLRRKELRAKNLEKVREYAHKWQANNRPRRKDALNARKRLLRPEYTKRKMREDIQFRFRERMRLRIIKLLKGTKKSYKTIELLGCTIRDARKHIEQQFRDGMTWNNWAFTGWHIDHIIPISSFDLTDPEQQKKCFHYTNLQPLWWWENLAKGDKLVA
jgi:hypothetical protein